MRRARGEGRDLGGPCVAVSGVARRLGEVDGPGHAEPFNMPKHSPGLSILRRIRDEADRFAITFHRQQRTKAMTTSVLDDIPGIGPQRLKAIWKVFSSLEEIANTEADQIVERARLPVAVAEAVRERAREVGSGK